jgi:F-type H+-transporting ATPase subunit alpha
MTENDREYIKYLVRKEIPLDTIDETRRILSVCSDLPDTLSNPVVTDEEKHGIIRQVFPNEMQTFMINVCDNGSVGKLNDIFSEYTKLCMEKQGSIRAIVRYVTPLTESQQEDMKGFIKEKFNRTDVNIEYRCDPDIIGGFILNAGDYEYDKSYRTSLRLMHESLKHRASEIMTGEDGVTDLEGGIDSAKRAND